METSLYSVIHSWFYNQHQLRVQLVDKENARSAQIRIVYGVTSLHFEQQGRPDGLKPNSAESYQRYLSESQQRAQRNKMVFHLISDDRDALEREAALYLIRALAFFRIGQYHYTEKDLLFVMTSLEFIVTNSKDSIIQEHYTKYLDVIILLYQKNLSLLNRQQGDYDTAAFTSQLAKRTLEKMYAHASASEFYFSEKDLKAISCFILDHADRPKLPAREYLYRQVMEEPSFAK